MLDRARLFLSLTLYGFALALAEVVLVQQGNYVLSTTMNLFLSLGIFSALMAGGLLGLHRFFARLELGWMHNLSGALLLSTMGGIYVLPAGALFFVTIGFVGFGIFSAQAFARYPLRQLVLAFGSGGAILCASLFPLYENLGHWILLLTVAVLPAAALLTRGSWRKVLFSAALLGIAVGAAERGFFEFESYAHRNMDGLKAAKKSAPTIFTPLMLTDLFWSTQQEASVIVTNGSRVSRVEHKPEGEGDRYPRYSASFDPPYLFARPKKVLIIGPAGGRNVATAMRYGVAEIWAVDINPAVFSLMNGPLARESRDLYRDSRVVPIAQEGRHFLETTKEKFDLIVLQGVQTGSRSNLVSSTVLESFLFTREAVLKVWEHLNPEGLAFFEEYQLRPPGKATMLENLARTAQRDLSLDSGRQIFSYQFAQSGKAVSSMHEGSSLRLYLREALMLGKRPLTHPDLHPLTSRPGYLSGQYGLPGVNAVFGDITDDHPFFLRFSLEKISLYLGAAFLLFSAVAARLAARGARQGPLPFGKAFGFFWMGVGYMAFVMAMIGPCTLLVGPPQIANPLMLGALFIGAMLGGLVALAMRARLASHVIWLLCVGLVAMPQALAALKPALLGEPSLLLRAFWLALVVGVGAILAEIPYVDQLRMLEAQARTRAFVWGKAGVLAGTLLGILMNLWAGFSGAFYAAAAAYLGSALFLTVMKIPNWVRLSGHRREDYA